MYAKLNRRVYSRSSYSSQCNNASGGRQCNNGEKFRFIGNLELAYLLRLVYGKEVSVKLTPLEDQLLMQHTLRHVNFCNNDDDDATV